VTSQASCAALQDISRKQGEQLLQQGNHLCRDRRLSTNEPHRLIAASIGVAQPADEDAYAI